MSYTKRPLKELNIMDDFLMNALASDPLVGKQFCQTVLSVLLQRQIGEIHITAQKVIPAAAPEKRGIRMDVVIEETVVEGTKEEAAQKENFLRIYDIESHIPNDIHLPKHNRFYQAKIDGRYPKSGMRDFGNMPELYIITLTNYDPFGYGYMMYRVENRCIELPELEYEDGLHYVYFYTGGEKGGSKEIKKLLEYMRDSRVEKATSEATRKLHEYVQKVKTEPEVEMEYMKFDDLLEYVKDEGREEGGREEAQRNAREFFRKGVDFEIVESCIKSISKEELEKIYMDVQMEHL